MKRDGMRETIARACRSAWEGGESAPWDQLNEHGRAAWFAQADAVLAVVQEEVDEVHRAGMEAVRQWESLLQAAEAQVRTLREALTWARDELRQPKYSGCGHITYRLDAALGEKNDGT